MILISDNHQLIRVISFASCDLSAVAHYNSHVLSSLLLGLYTGGAGKEAGSGGL